MSLNNFGRLIGINNLSMLLTSLRENSIENKEYVVVLKHK